MTDEARIKEITQAIQRGGIDVVALCWPLLDDHKLAEALAHDCLDRRMFAVAGLIETVVPMPSTPAAFGAVRSAIRLGVLARLVKC